MIRAIVVLTACVLAAPAVAQAPSGQVDAAAILRFDPDGGTGVPLTKETVQAYLAAPIIRPTEEEYREARARLKAAETARRVLLANETLFAPLWEEQAFELQDGSIRSMTADEKAVFREVETAGSAIATLDARRTMSGYSDSERATLADALCGLLDAGVRITDRSDGYRKAGDDWMWFDWENGDIVASHKPDPQAEIALLRYELAQQRIGDAVLFRFQMTRNAQAAVAPF